MSHRSRARRKLARQIFRSSKDAPRAIAAETPSTTRGYPCAHDLLASGQGWREFLETALREVLRPVALVSAVGLAGCGAQAHAPALGAAKPSEAQGSGTGAVLVPMPPSGGTQRVVTGSLPPPPDTSTTTAVVQTTPVPAVHHPQGGTLHGTPNVVPLPTPLAVRGEMTSVTPTPDPIPLGGAPVPVMPDPQPPTPQPPPIPQPPQPQVNPQPDPPPMPGGMAIVAPPAPPTPVAGS